MDRPISVVILGATGMVGSHVVKSLLKQQSLISQITILGRRKIENLEAGNIKIQQYEIDIFKPESYRSFISGHSLAICTLGVGQPSSVSKEQFINIDKTAVIEFAKICKEAGVPHFEILSSLGANPSSSMFYLKTKGELNEALKSMDFKRLSIFQPSLIITPTNRYGLSQWLSLKIFPILKPILVGPMKKYRGIPVADLGKAIALNIFSTTSGVEVLHWEEIQEIIRS